ncbi:MAG: glycosyltransferase family 2 protein, partial [Limnoraphis sp.]
MNQKIDVSVIIPTYNRIYMLEEALKSVLTQEFDGTVEIIVVDDNSSDKTSEIIDHKYPQINLISLKQNGG